MKRGWLVIVLICFSLKSRSWGFYTHRLINYYAVFMLPPEMMVLYKHHLVFISEHAVDPDKRRYAVAEEGPRHYIDMDRYGHPGNMPRSWADAVAKYTEDTLKAHGIVPWWIQTMRYRLTAAFRERDQKKILKLSADLGHYIGDAHVPLHACSNHNGQFTDQRGIHGFWESRVPELLAEKEWDFFVGKAAYLPKPLDFMWDRVLESAAAADSVLLLEKELSSRFPADRKYAYENRSGVLVKQYSSEYSRQYNTLLNDMAERRFRQSVYAVASFWYTAWVNAGKPDLSGLAGRELTESDQQEFREMNDEWIKGNIKGRACD